MICGRLEGRCHRRGKSFLVVGPRLFILFGEKVAHLIFSLSLSLSGQFQIGERITTELIITDVLSVNRGIASRGNFEEDTNLNIFEISNYFGSMFRDGGDRVKGIIDLSREATFVDREQE